MSTGFGVLFYFTTSVILSTGRQSGAGGGVNAKSGFVGTMLPQRLIAPLPAHLQTRRPVWKTIAKGGEEGGAGDRDHRTGDDDDFAEQGQARGGAA